MSDLKVTVVYCSEDGDHSITMYDKDDFLAQLNKGEFGEKPEFVKPGSLSPNQDLNYVKGSYILIDGPIVAPKPVEVATKFEL